MKYVAALLFIIFVTVSGFFQLVPGFHHGNMQMMPAIQMDGCEGVTCIMGIDFDCLEHCLASATVPGGQEMILNLVTFLLAVAASIIVVFEFRKLELYIHQKEWYPPLYHFETVRLIE
ncbi:MAG: hypothetical protein ABIG66_05090 [Candidatus Kerfeldbacteria bacterium]